MARDRIPEKGIVKGGSSKRDSPFRCRDADYVFCLRSSSYGRRVSQSAIRLCTASRFARRANLSQSASLISPPNHRHLSGHPAPARGAYRDRHGRWERDAMDAMAPQDERRQGGRRSRVVLTPRRWRQVSWSLPRSDGGKRARSPGRARSKPLKPLRGECRMLSGASAVNTRAHTYYPQRARGCGCIGHPAFPAPSDLLGRLN